MCTNVNRKSESSSSAATSSEQSVITPSNTTNARSKSHQPKGSRKSRAKSAQGKKVRWRGGDNRLYDTDVEEERKKILEQSNAELISSAETSTDPALRQLGVQIQQRDLTQQLVDLVSRGNELTQEEIDQARDELEESGEFARENERLGFNADGTVRDDNGGDATVEQDNRDPFGDGITNMMSIVDSIMKNALRCL